MLFIICKSQYSMEGYSQTVLEEEKHIVCYLVPKAGEEHAKGMDDFKCIDVTLQQELQQLMKGRPYSSHLCCLIKSVQLPKIGFQLGSSWCLLLLSDPSYVVMSLFLISHSLWNLQKAKCLCSTPDKTASSQTVITKKVLMVLSLKAQNYTEHACKLVFLQEAKLRLKNPKWLRLFTPDLFFFLII